jgi:hypothetical protein
MNHPGSCPRYRGARPADFLERGRQLAGRLARELGPGYRVTYQGDGSIPEQEVSGTEPVT